MRKMLIAILALCFIFIGCVTTGYQPPTPPAGCEGSLFWKSRFMPLGPGVAITAVEVALLAEPKATPEVRAALVMAYPVIKTGNLAEIKAIMRKDKIAKFFTPPLTLIEQWEKAGVLPKVKIAGVEQYQLDPCDRQILLDMVRDAALVAGADPKTFD